MEMACSSSRLVATTGLLTVATRFRSSRQHIPAWGSSTVALMLRGPWSHAPEMLPSINSTKRMQRRAKRTEVALERTAHGDWRLSWQNLGTEDDYSSEPESSTSISAFGRAFLSGASRENFGGKRPVAASSANKGTTKNTRTHPLSRSSTRVQMAASVSKALPMRPLSASEGQTSRASYPCRSEI